MKSIKGYLGLALVLTVFMPKAFAYNKTQLLVRALKVNGIQVKNAEVNLSENPIAIPGFAAFKSIVGMADKEIGPALKSMAVREAFFTVGSNNYNCWFISGPVTSNLNEVIYVAALQNCEVDGRKVTIPKKFELMSVAYSKQGYRKITEDEFNDIMNETLK